MELASLSGTMHVLAGAAPRQRGVHTWIDLHDHVRRGLPTSMYRHVRQVLERSPFPAEVVDRLSVWRLPGAPGPRSSSVRHTVPRPRR